MKEQVELECYSCESVFMVLFNPNDVSCPQPEVCPFCGDTLEDPIDEDEEIDDDEDEMDFD